LYIAPGKVKTLALSGYPNADLEFKEYFRLGTGDSIHVEISLDDGVTWANIRGVMTNVDSTNPPDDWYSQSYTLSGFTLTDQTQIRFRFKSDAVNESRGWFIDDVHIKEGATDIFGPDPCEDFDDFISERTAYGCYWFHPNAYEFAYSTMNLDAVRWMLDVFTGAGPVVAPVLTYYWPILIGGGFPGFTAPISYPPWYPPGALEYGWGCYDPLWTQFDPQLAPSNRPWHGIYPDNLDCKLVWTFDADKCFYGYIDGTNYFDLENGFDFGFFQIKTPSMGAYDTIEQYTGTRAQDVFGIPQILVPYEFWPYYDPYWWSSGPWDITPYLTEPQVQLRWRMTSDSINTDICHGYGFMWMQFYGMKDTNPPTTTVALEGTFDPVFHYWTSEIAVTLTAVDDLTGVKTTYYELDGVQHTYDGPFLIEDDGEHTLCYWSEDNEGNVETKKCIVPFRIDQTGPEVTITGPESGLYIGGNLILPSEKYIFLFGGVPLSASVTIDGAPLQTVQFFMNDVLFHEDTSAPYEAFCTEKNSGPATFKVKAIDVLGEDDEKTLAVDFYLKLF
jgi:hypothetical protein